MKRQLPAHIFSCLIILYTDIPVRSAWRGVMYVHFLAITGVKQGGVINPVLL